MKPTFALSVSALVASVMAEPRNFTTIQPSGTFNPAAATAVQTHYPKYHHTVKGRKVDHIWHIVLDSADFEDAESNSDLQALREQGILLDNYYALTHPAQPNYLGMVAGDYFGLQDERFVALPSNISTIVESMEEQRVLWAQYQEGQPFTAYTGWEYQSADSQEVDYSRAKNPLIAFNSITENPRRFINLRSLATFYGEQGAGTLPQWLLIRPNLQNDGSTTDLATAASWARTLLEPLLSEKSSYHRHLFVLTFAHAATEDAPNRVYTLLLGDLKEKEKGSTDHTYYDHYSIAASTQANFDLPTLGRYDCNANVFEYLNSKAHVKNHEVEVGENHNSIRTAGWLSDLDAPLPIPNLNCEGRGRAGLLRNVKKIWKKASYSYYQWTVNY